MLYNPKYAKETFYRDTAKLDNVILNRQNSLLGKSKETNYEDLFAAMQMEANITKKLESTLDFNSLNKSEQYYFSEMYKFILLPYNYIYICTFPMFNIICRKRQCKGISDYNLKQILDRRREFNDYYSSMYRQLIATKGYIDSSLTKFLTLYMDTFDNIDFKVVDPYFAQMFKDYLNNKRKKQDFEFEFMCRYLFSKKQRSIVDTFGKINNIGRKDVQLLYTNVKETGVLGQHQTANDTITVSPDVTDVVSLMDVTFHELTHYVQSLRVKNRIFSDYTFEYILFLLLGRQKGKDGLKEYDRNYSQQEIEYEANETAISDTIGFLNDIGITNAERSNLIHHLVNSSIELKNNRELSLRRSDLNSLFENSAVFKFKELNKLLENSPSLVRRYPIFSVYYDYNGKMKDYISILKNPDIAKNNSLLAGTTFQCMEYLISTNKIDVNALYQEKDKLSILVGISNICHAAYSSLLNIKNFVNKNHITRFNNEKKEKILLIRKTLYKMVELATTIDTKNNYYVSEILNISDKSESMIREILSEPFVRERN